MEQLQSLSLSFKCDKAFGTLQPCEGGWYCNGCQKLVHDLRGKPEQEIRDILAENNYKLCGMFEADRIRVNTPLPKWRKWAAAAVMALGFTSIHQTLLAQHVPEKIIIDTPKTVEDNQIFGVVEDSAEFPGGLEKFYKYLHLNLVDDGSGRAGKKGFVTFVIETDGSLTDIKMLRSSFSDKLNERIIQIVKRSPKWKPGKRFGKPIKLQYTIPVVFTDK